MGDNDREELEEEGVHCSDGHYNFPYPESGMCGTCNNFLPGNSAASAGKVDHKGFSKTQRAVAARVLADEGVSWASAPEAMKQLALQFSKTRNNKTLELILSQLSKLKARPKPGEERRETKFEINLTSNTLENLHRSLDELDELETLVDELLLLLLELELELLLDWLELELLLDDDEDDDDELLWLLELEDELELELDELELL